MHAVYAVSSSSCTIDRLEQMMALRYDGVKSLFDHLNSFQGIINQVAGMSIKLI